MYRGGNQVYASPEEALKHFGIRGMHWGVRKKEDEGSGQRSYSPKEGFTNGARGYELTNPKALVVNHTHGFADITPLAGMTPAGRQQHDDVVSAVQRIQAEYPSLSGMRFEVAPASHAPHGADVVAEESPAAAIHLKQGHIQVMYNDRMPSFDPQRQKEYEAFIPGVKYPGYTATHEMGHVLAASKGLVPPGWDVLTERNPVRAMSKMNAHQVESHNAHLAMFVKHGIPLDQIGKLSAYATTSPDEAFAEIFANYHTPPLRQKMSPEMQRAAKSMLDDVGGK